MKLIMNPSIILLSIGFLISNAYAVPQCNNEMCLETCKQIRLNGTCDSQNHCKCPLGQSCFKMTNTCREVCGKFGMDGECDGINQCQCDVIPELCHAEKCRKTCDEDPRARDAITGGALRCSKYISVTFCECMYFQLESDEINREQWYVIQTK